MLLTPAAGGAENMALDEALMSRARETGEWTLRVYSWSRATISFGRNEAARRHYDPGRIGARDLAVVRRPTGGRAILHDREITYSVTAPAADAGDLRASYDRINTLLLGAFQRAAPGFPTVVSYQGQPEDPNVSCAPGEPQTSPGSCGTPLPVKYDLTFSMRKGDQYSFIDVLVGTAATMPVECLTDTPGQPSPNPKCHHTVVNGVTVLDMSSDVQGNTAVHYYAVAAVHPDGTVVEVLINAPVVGATPFITKEQAIKVAIDPTVSLHP